MLIMTSIIRVGQSKFVTIQIDEDSNERIMNCIQTLSELNVPEQKDVLKEVFLDDTRKAFEKMLGAQEVRTLGAKTLYVVTNCFAVQKRAAEKKAAESKKAAVVQVDDLLNFRQFSKKTADDAIDVRLLILSCQPCHSFVSVDSMMRMLVVQLALLRFRKISCLI
jgi:coatomer subunit beta